MRLIRGQQGGKLYNKWRAYGQVKTANVLMGVALAESLGGRGLTAVSLHPGVIDSTHLSDRRALRPDSITRRRNAALRRMCLRRLSRV